MAHNPPPLPESAETALLDGKNPLAEPEKADRQSRQEAAIGLAVAGANLTEIARVLGYASANHARQAIERGLAATVGPEQKDHLREINRRRLERVLSTLYPKATDEESEEHLAYARTFLAFADRLIRLDGLDAPTEMTIYSPAEREIADWVQRMAARTQSDMPEELDIINGEVIAGELSASEIDATEEY